MFGKKTFKNGFVTKRARSLFINEGVCGAEPPEDSVLFVNIVYQIDTHLFIVFSLIFALILMMGSFSRLMKIVKSKSRQIKIR